MSLKTPFLIVTILHFVITVLSAPGPAQNGVASRQEVSDPSLGTELGTRHALNFKPMLGLGSSHSSQDASRTPLADSTWTEFTESTSSSYTLLRRRDNDDDPPPPFSDTDDSLYERDAVQDVDDQPDEDEEGEGEDLFGETLEEYVFLQPADLFDLT